MDFLQGITKKYAQYTGGDDIGGRVKPKTTSRSIHPGYGTTSFSVRSLIRFLFLDLVTEHVLLRRFNKTC